MFTAPILHGPHLSAQRPTEQALTVVRVFGHDAAHEFGQENGFKEALEEQGVAESSATPVETKKSSLLRLVDD